MYGRGIGCGVKQKNIRSPSLNSHSPWQLSLLLVRWRCLSLLESQRLNPENANHRDFPLHWRGCARLAGLTYPSQNIGPLEDDIGSGRDTQVPGAPGVVDQEENQSLQGLPQKPHLLAWSRISLSVQTVQPKRLAPEGVRGELSSWLSHVFSQPGDLKSKVKGLGGARLSLNPCIIFCLQNIP